MKCDKKYMLLYAVTDRAWVGKQSLYEQVESALKGGATCVQLREKELNDDEFLAEAIEIGALCRKYSVPFFVNDNVDVAVKCHADGVHVGQEDMAASKVREKIGDGMMLGVSVHTVEEALKAVDGLRGIHDFRMVSGEKNSNLIFDIVVPSGMDEADAEGIKLRIAKAAHDIDPTFRCVITIDRDYTGCMGG